jgi:glycerate dehydrogenase
MKIVFLDGYALNPGDLSWQPLEELGELTVYDRSAPDETVLRAAGAAVLMTNKVYLGADELSRLPQLRYIGISATGVNVVDLKAARAHDIAVTNVPAYSTASVAQHVFALLLELSNGVGHHAQRVAQGGWSDCPDFSFRETPQIELAGRTLGIVGFGDIGQAVARIAAGFGMQLLVHTRTPKPDDFPGIRFVDLETLLTKAEVVSLNCPLTPQTERMIDAGRLASMKREAVLINTGRGALIDETALAAALRDGVIAGAGLDVLSVEPPEHDNPLFSAPNCFITPHLAWATRAARQRLIAELAANLRAFGAGEQRNRVE